MKILCGFLSGTSVMDFRAENICKLLYETLSSVISTFCSDGRFVLIVYGVVWHGALLIIVCAILLTLCLLIIVCMLSRVDM